MWVGFDTWWWLISPGINSTQDGPLVLSLLTQVLWPGTWPEAWYGMQLRVRAPTWYVQGLELFLPPHSKI